MAKSLQLKYVAWFCLALSWCTVATATENQLVAGVAAIPFDAIRNVLVLSSLGGMGATLTRICQPDTIIRNMPLEIFRDAVVSILAGTLMFSFTSWIPSVVSFWPQVILITVAGYCGGKIIDVFGNGTVSWLEMMFRRVFGLNTKDNNEGGQP